MYEGFLKDVSVNIRDRVNENGRQHESSRQYMLEPFAPQVLNIKQVEEEEVWFGISVLV